MIAASSALRVLVRAHRRMAWNTLVRVAWPKRFAALLVAALLLFYGVELTRVLRYFYTTLPDPHTFAVANFAMIFLFAIVRATSFALQWFITDDDLELLGALPLPNGALFGIKLIGTIVDVLRFAILSIPLFLAYGLALGVGIGAWALYGFGWLALWIIAGGCGVLVALGMIGVLRGSRQEVFFKILSVGVTAAFFGILMFYANLSREGGAERIAEYLAPWRPTLSWLPTTWTAQLLDPGFPFPEALGLLAVTFGVVLSAHRLFVRRYRIEDVLLEKSGARLAARSHLRRRRTTPHHPLTALLLKEWRVAARDPSLIFSWIAPLALMLLFLTLTKGSPPPGNAREFAMALVGFLVAFLVGFSLVSREGPAFGTIRAHLEDVRLLVVAKVLFSALLLFPLLLFWTVTWRPFALHGELVIEAALLAVAYSTFGVGIGAIFPQFRTQGRPRGMRLSGLFALYLFFSLTVILLAVSATVSLGWIGRFVGLVPAVVGLATAHVGARRLARRDVL